MVFVEVDRMVEKLEKKMVHIMVVWTVVMTAAE
jgi:hypothetical protein